MSAADKKAAEEAYAKVQQLTTCLHLFGAGGPESPPASPQTDEAFAQILTGTSKRPLDSG